MVGLDNFAQKAPCLGGGRRASAKYRHLSTKEKPLVSIVTVVFNSVQNLQKTIDSVTGQSYDNIEYIVVDGGSTDGTVEIIRQCEHNIDYWVSEADSGIYDAMNKGIGLAQGELIGIIGAGDWYEENAVERAVEAYLRTGADVVYGDVEIVDAETGLSYGRQSNIELMPKTMSSISHPTTFVKSSLYHLRPFDTQMHIAADYKHFLGLYVEGCRFEHSGGTAVHILTGGVSSSSRAQIEVFKVHRKYYGVLYAASRLALSGMRRAFYAGRRAVLERALSRARFAAARNRWLRYKHRNNKKTEG